MKKKEKCSIARTKVFRRGSGNSFYYATRVNKYVNDDNKRRRTYEFGLRSSSCNGKDTYIHVCVCVCRAQTHTHTHTRVKFTSSFDFGKISKCRQISQIFVHLFYRTMEFSKRERDKWIRVTSLHRPMTRIKK